MVGHPRAGPDGEYIVDEPRACTLQTVERRADRPQCVLRRWSTCAMAGRSHCSVNGARADGGIVDGTLDEHAVEREYAVAISYETRHADPLRSPTGVVAAL